MRKIAAVAVLAVLSLAAVAAAQQAVAIQEVDLGTYLDLLRQDVRAQRAELMGQAMALDTDGAAKFWPVYREYEIEADKLAEARNDLIKRYADTFSTLTDANANEIAETLFSLDQQQLQLKKAYYERIKGTMGAAKAARFVQIDNQLDMMIRLQIASQLPLMEKVQ